MIEFVPNTTAAPSVQRFFLDKNYGAFTNMNWLEVLASVTETVEPFIQDNDDRDPDNYQVKWLPLRFLFSRNPVGELRYLPNRAKVRFVIRLI